MTSPVFAEYADYDAIGLAELIRSGQVSTAEVLSAARERYDALNPKLNAVVHQCFDDALRSTTDTPHGPFHGVPFMLKDLVAQVKGLPSTNGSVFTKDVIALEDSELVRRYRRSGVAIVGKTSTPELGGMPTTEPKLFGPCRNPWDTERSVGGSSGGSAAAVAAGLVPFAHGNDGGGSLRIPAACCGVFGFKPTRGRTPMGSESTDMARRFVVEHVVSRSVRDSAAMLDASIGHFSAAQWSLPAPDTPFLSAVSAVPRRLRIGVTIESPLGVPIHPEVRAAVEKTAALCAHLGHDVEEVKLRFDAMQAFRDYITLMCMNAAETYVHLCNQVGRKAKRDELEPMSRLMVVIGNSKSIRDYAEASVGMDRVAAEIMLQHEPYDAILTPANATPPPPLGHFGASPADNVVYELVTMLNAGWIMKIPAIMDAAILNGNAYISCLVPANMTGQPAMTLPLFRTEEGLPIGSHFTGRLGEDAVLFSLAGQIEREMPWVNHRPRIW